MVGGAGNVVDVAMRQMRRKKAVVCMWIVKRGARNWAGPAQSDHLEWL